jgi:proteic killer suppression protein
VIKSFRDKDTQAIFERRSCPRFKAFERVAQRKLVMVNQARQLSDLAVPPNNRLEALQRERKGQHAIRINAQWRVCFVWRDGDAYQVEITDYH